MAKWALPRYIIQIADKDGKQREHYSKKNRREQVKPYTGDVVNHDAFSALARLLTSNDSIVRIVWYLDERQIANTGWFPVGVDKEVIDAW